MHKNGLIVHTSVEFRISTFHDGVKRLQSVFYLNRGNEGVYLISQVGILTYKKQNKRRGGGVIGALSLIAIINPATNKERVHNQQCTHTIIIRRI